MCIAVCLIYVERLMETAYVPLVSKTWRPVLLCGLLLASKVWQDLRYVLFYTFVVCPVVDFATVSHARLFHSPNIHNWSFA